MATFCHFLVERNWATKYWPDRFHAYFLALSEINTNYLQGYLVDGVDTEPRLDFWHQLGWYMVENVLDEETEAVGVNRRRPRARRRALGDHELVTAQKYCGKCLVDENQWRRVKRPYQKQICNNQSGDCNFFTMRRFRRTNGFLLCAEFYATPVLDADTQVLNH